MQRANAILESLIFLALLFASPLLAGKQEAWVEVRSPNFIVVSNAGEKKARITAIRFEQIRTVFRNSLPFASAHPSPVITILALKDDSGMRALLPDYWVKGHAHPAGFFACWMNQYYAAINLQARGSNPYGTLYHEYYHSLTLPYSPNLPLWLAEGLAEFYGNTELREKEASMGRPGPELLEQLKQNKLIPLDVLFQVGHNSPYYNEAVKTSIFYPESWALTHYLLNGDREAHRPELLAYIHELDSGATQEQATAKAFGDLKKLESVLAKYIDKESFYYTSVPAPPAIPDANLHARPLSQAEVDAYRGGFIVVRGKPQDAKPLLEEAIHLDPKVALAYQNLALAQFMTGQSSEALASAARAIELDPRNATTRYVRAYLSFNSRGRFGSTAQLEDDLRQAIAADPNLAPAYPLFAMYLAARGAHLSEALSLAQKGISLEPGNYNSHLALAQVLLRTNRFDDAEAAALIALKLAQKPQETASAQSFIATLKQAREFHARYGTGVQSNDDRVIQLVTGVARDVKCMPLLHFKVVSDAGTFAVREEKDAEYKMLVEGSEDKSFDPCGSLEGRDVTVNFYTDEDEKTAGVIYLLRVLRHDDRDSRTLRGNAPGGATVLAAEGSVSNLTCNGNEMWVTLSIDGRPQSLHSKDLTTIVFTAGTHTAVGNMTPCTDLKGRTIKIGYIPSDQPKSVGEIQAIIIEK